MGHEKQPKDSSTLQGIVANKASSEQTEAANEHLAETLQEAIPYPSMYQVIMLNDDFTPMEFVTEILERVFFMPPLEARGKMLQVHHDGQAICGLYTHDVAETKVIQVMDTAMQYQYPLKCIMRKETRYAIKKS